MAQNSFYYTRKGTLNIIVCIVTSDLVGGLALSHFTKETISLIRHMALIYVT